MTGITASKRIVFVIVAAAAIALASFVPSAKAENLRSTPQVSVYGTSCGFSYAGSRTITPEYSILAANLYYGYVESQRVYERSALYQWTSDGWTLLKVGEWRYGKAFDFVGPMAWSRLSDDLYLGDGNYRDTWTIRGSGSFLIRMQFAWDESSAGAPEDRSVWIWSSNYCTI